MSERPTTPQEKEVLKYLNSLSESGITNMFGTTPYVVREFIVSEKEAIRLLSLWMKNFNEENNYETIKL